MGYKEDILARNPIAYWKLEADTSANLGTYNPIGTSAKWTSSSGYMFDTYGIDGIDSMAFLDDSSYVDFGHLNLNPSKPVTSFSIEFWFNFNYASSKNRRIPLIWKDFDLDGTYTNGNGYGFAVYAIPLESTVFLEIYLFDDTDTPAFYTHILKKEDFDWYQITLTTQLANNADEYLHKLYLDNILISTTLRNRRLTKPQFGDDNIFCNRTNHNTGLEIDQFFGYIDEVSIYDYALPESTITATHRPTVPMTFEITPTLIDYLEYFIIDGIQHDFLPDSFMNISGEYGVKTNSYPTLDLKRIIVSHGNPRELAGHINRRKTYRQAWDAVWSGPDHGSFMDIWMRDQLFSLYTTQRSFWMQYDSEMYRTSSRLHQVGNDYNVYYTPTYPIIPYGYDPLHNRIRTYTNHLFVNGVLYDGAFTVDEETGAIVFETALEPTDEVTLNYLWRARVRIKDFNIEPMADAPDAYIGMVTFEQVDFNLNDDPWLITLPRELGRFYDLGPTDESCAVDTSVPSESIPSTWTSDGSIGLTIGNDTSNKSLYSDGSFASQGAFKTNFHTFRQYKTLPGRINGMIPEIAWNIGRGSEMGIKGCDKTLREDYGISPLLYPIYEKLSGPNDGDYFNFETEFMYFYLANNMPNILSYRTIVGIEFNVEYVTRNFRIPNLNYNSFIGQNITAMEVIDAWVVPIVGGIALFDASHNKAQGLNISKVVAANTGPYYENYANTTVTYGGLGKTWGREWTVDEVKGLFGVAIKLQIRAHKEFFHPAVYNSMSNRANPVIWCNEYRVHYI